MFAPLRRTLVYFVELFTGKRDPLISSEPVETSPDSLRDVYVKDPKIVSSASSHYNLRERKPMNYSEEIEEVE